MSGWYDDQGPQSSYTIGGPDGGNYGPAPKANAPAPLMKREAFYATVKPDMLDASGKFKAPTAGVNYMLEGLTPQEAYDTAKSIREGGVWSDDNPSGKSGGQDQELLDVAWRDGPDNGGGGIAGIGRAIGNTATGIAHNPALMAALTAGIGSYFAPAASSGAALGGLETGGSAGIGSGTVLGGGTAAVEPGIISSVMASPYAPYVKAGIKTYASGGNLSDLGRNLVGNYVGSAVSGVASDADIPGSGIIGNVVGSAVTGGDPLKALVNGGISAATDTITSGIDGFSDMPDFQKTMIKNTIAATLKGKPPTQALVNQARNAAMAQFTRGKSTSSHGGWSV